MMNNQKRKVTMENEVGEEIICEKTTELQAGLSFSTFALFNHISVKPHKPCSHCNILAWHQHIMRCSARLNFQERIPNFKESSPLIFKSAQLYNSGTHAKISAMSCPKYSQCNRSHNELLIDLACLVCTS